MGRAQLETTYLAPQVRLKIQFRDTM